ncbi:uncharacterized protein LOC127239334 [Andrographis paniculata]|uniref:uncharacterized protein LOC127239334 n=1 Tax=Andrographis paniculata TaxID=175694 RepID=UPI0021E713F8|nr:uncharacterized protein LOC127239334 [Andrographis paniculata]
MDVQRALLLQPNWMSTNDYYMGHHKEADLIREATLVLTMEVEETKAKAAAEMKLKDAEISRLREMVAAAINDRNEALEKCRKLAFENNKLLLRQKNSRVSTSGDDLRLDSGNGGFSASSDCDESIVSSPPPSPSPPVAVTKPLPEKGKLLEAVVKAGPLLQNLLVAGPLPQWRRPPPPIDSCQIPPPPVVVPSGRKRGVLGAVGGLTDPGGEYRDFDQQIIKGSFFSDTNQTINI